MKLQRLLSFGRQPRRRALDQVREFATVIGAGSVFAGSLTGKDNYVVYGRVIGDAELDGTVWLAPGGRWRGDIVATQVVIGGELDGNVTARAKLELGPQARVHGDISSPVIAIAEGAQYDGVLRMKQAQITRYRDRRGQPDGPDDADA